MKENERWKTMPETLEVDCVAEWQERIVTVGEEEGRGTDAAFHPSS